MAAIDLCDEAGMSSLIFNLAELAGSSDAGASLHACTVEIYFLLCYLFFSISCSRKYIMYNLVLVLLLCTGRPSDKFVQATSRLILMTIIADARYTDHHSVMTKSTHIDAMSYCLRFMA